MRASLGLVPPDRRRWLAELLGCALLLSGCGGPSHRRAAACPDVVASALGHVALRLYGESVSSEVTRVARHLIERSLPLQAAVAADDRAGAERAVRALIATGHMTRMRVVRSGRVLADVGPALALSPLRGVLRDAGGRPIGRYVASTMSASAFVGGVRGLTLAPAVITQGRRTLIASVPGGAPVPPVRGAFTFHGERLANFTFPAEGFPGSRLLIHVVPTYAYARQNCGATERDTVHRLIGGALTRIYRFEASSGQTLTQVHRVERDARLLTAVARDDPVASRLAILALLNHHIVRLRVSDGSSRLLGDVGGPYVLAPVAGRLTLGGRTIGHFVLSIQDDLGYLLLSRRLAHSLLVMRRGGRTVMSALRPAPANVPKQGAFSVNGHDYEVFSFTAQAFPSGPLQVFALIPFPYR